MSKSALIIAVVLLNGLTIGALDASDAEQQCAAAFDACMKACDEDHKGDTAGRAACVPGCSGRYAACDAGVAYEKAKPWLEDQANKTKKFFEGLMENLQREMDKGPEGSTGGSTEKDKSI